MKKKIFLLSLILAIALMMVGCDNITTNNNEFTNGVTNTEQTSGKGNENQNQQPSGTEDLENENKYADIEQNPVVTLEIQDVGMIKMELYPQIAPESVENFISLVESGFYNGLVFHRTIPGFMAQGGDPLGNGTGGPGYSIVGEFAANNVQNNLSHTRSIVSMARSQDYNTAGSQFFIVTTDSTYLDGQYAAFGKVIEGMDVVDTIVNSEVVRRDLDEGLDYYSNPEEYIKQSLEKDRPVTPPVIKTATVDTFGVEYDEPEKITE